jgi:release factor glutamine methyltransferase
VNKEAPPRAWKLLERGAHELERGGVTQSRWEAELLLRHALGWTREFLLAHPDEPVQAEAAGHFFQLVERRRGRVPLQYLLGVQEFWGMEFRVTPAVLIPRPETEGLVEQALLRLGGRPAKVADVGCGSGCIAVVLASELPEAEIYATDISPAALAVARENAVRQGVGDRIEFLPGDLMEPLYAKGLRLDAVVSNPPYLIESEMNTLAPEVKEHEPRLALAAGSDGLGVITRLLPQAGELLAEDGLLLLEIGVGMERQAKELVAENGLVWESTVPDLQGIPRVLVAKKKNKCRSNLFGPK